MKQHFIIFFRKFWWWNILIDIFLFLLFVFFLSKFLNNSPKENNTQLALINGITLTIGVLHLVYIFIVLLKRLFKKEWFISIFLAIHLAGIIYLCSLLIMSFFLLIGFTGTG